MIPDIIELNFPKKEGKQYATLTQATANIADMGEKTITTQVKIDGEIVPDFSFDWEVEFQGEKYIMPLRIPQGAKENTSLKSTIDLTFQHWAIYQLKRWPFVTIQQIAAGTYLPDEEVATVQLNLKDFCTLFGQVLDYYYNGAITIDLNPAWQYKQEATIITISHTKIWNVLIDAFHDKYGVRWEIKAASGNSNTVKGGERYVIRVGYPTTEVDHIFEYGFEGGLLKVERQVQSDEIRNMLKGRGGDTNIPFRYFKDTDPNNPDFRPDPDWVEELANIYFPNLMPATFRSYVQGWKAAHISKYAGYTAVGENNAYAPWAYRKGYTDEKFSPVEFVADEITIAPEVGDKQVEILPGYSPYVKKGSSLDKYGPLPDTLDNNDDIYPTLQGTGLDIAVAVEQIESDDVAESTESDAQVRTLDKEVSAVKKVEKTQRAELIIQSRNFTVDTGKTANLDEGTKNIVLTKDDKKFVWRSNGKWGPHVETFQVRVENGNVTIEDASLVVVNAATGQEVSASGIQSGTYYFRLSLAVYNTATETYNVSVECPEPKLTTATLDDNKWSNTFDIWVKNIWNSTRQSGETDSQYSERVWKSVLGDRDKNTAKVVFTSGALAMSEDYEFVIVDFPTPDTSKTWEDVDGVTHTSHWRITLAKSDAELEATGLYVPSTKKQGKAGDTFVFIGTEMAHKPYVTDAEIRLDDWKKNQLGEVKEIKPTAVVTTDRVRLNNEGKPNALINQLRVGNSLRLFDKRFFNEDGKAYETLYLQSITYTYREPSSDDAALNPDVEIVLGEKYAASTNPVSLMQGEIDALQRQVGSISNIAQIVRAIGDKLYLRKDGISDRSLSPTQFLSLLTSVDFRAGLVGGAGWGFYQDENGNWVLETDKINARQDITANSLVINQVEGRGGMIVESAASMIVTRVDDTSAGYVCHFDQKDGSVANLFHLNDVAYCQRFTPENGELKYYRRKVTAIGVDSITLSKTDVDGSGIPEEGDKIVHFGNYVDKTRQYVKVRDVVNGGYERYIEGLDSVSAEGTEYYFVGRQYGLYGGKPRWFIGDPDGEYAEWINGKLNINGSLSIGSTIGGDTFEEYIKKVSPPVTQDEIEGFVENIMKPTIDNLQEQIDGVIETWFYNGVPTLDNHPANEWTSQVAKMNHLGDLYYDNNTGTAYRFSQKEDKSFYWNVITDDAISKALEAAKEAQDTADNKRRVFVAQPKDSDTYDEGDLWVNATYGTTYKNDILRANQHKDAGSSFNISHWSKSSKYTDDTLAKAVQEQVNNLQSELNDLDSEVGAMQGFTDKAFADGIIDRSESAAIRAYLNTLATITNDVQKAYDSLTSSSLLPSATKTNIQNLKAVFDAKNNALVVLITNVIADDKATTDERAQVNAAYTEFNTAYANLIYALNQANTEIMGGLNININKLAYLQAALKQDTVVSGGLILSSIISLGINNSDFTTQETYSGLSGIYDNSKRGKGIAAWYGGDMIDKFDYYDASTGKFNIPDGVRVAMALDRMDGTGYRANGNLWWDVNGVVHADPLSFFVGPSAVGALLASFQVVLQADNVHPDYIIPQVPFQELNVADTIWTERLRIGDGYLRWDKDNRAFYVVDTDGNLANFYGNQLTAGGIGSGGSGGGGLVSAIRRWEDLGGAFSNADNDTFNAYTVNTIYTQLNAADGALSARVAALEGGSALSVQVTGGGNAVTDITKSGTTITATKGTTFLTQHQSLTEYLKKTDAASLYQPKGDYLTAITKAQVEAVLTGNITSHTHSQYLTAQSLSNYVTLDSEQTVTGHKIFAATGHKGYSGYNVPLTVKSSICAGIEISCGSYTHGIGTHNNGSWYWWRADGWPTYSSEVNGRYIMQYDGTSFDFKDPVRATKLILAGGSSSQFLKADGSVDGNAYLPLTGGSMTGPVLMYDKWLAKPLGGQLINATQATETGAICITLPDVTADNTMLSMWVDVFNCVNHTSFSVHICGYVNTSSNRWYRQTAIVTGAQHNVRFAITDGRYKVYIGDADSVWSYPQVTVRDVMLGYRSVSDKWAKAWKVSIETELPSSASSAYKNYTFDKLNHPTTLLGYGITNAYSKTQADARYALASSLGAYIKKTGDTMTGRLTVSVDNNLPMVLVSSGAATECGVSFKRNDENKGWVGWFDSWGAVLYTYSGAHKLGINPGGTPHFDGHTLWHADNDGAGSGLDADLLDGAHADDIRKSVMRFKQFTGTSTAGGYDLNTLAPDGGLITNYDGMDYWANAPEDASYGISLHIRSNNPVLGGQLFADIHHNSATDVTRNLWWRASGIVNNVKTWGKWHQIAFTDSNVASATKLQTARTLWGQSFDGSANVSGQMTGVGKIFMNANSCMYAPDPSGTNRTIIDFYSGQKPTFAYGFATGGVDVEYCGNNIFLSYGTGHTKGLVLNSSGNVGIGTEAPTCALDVNGTLTAVSIKVGAATMVYADEALLVQGNLAATGEVSAGAASDARLKDDIQGITAKEAMAVIEKLNPVTFRWNGTAYELGRKKGRSQGFLAHEYESVIPGSGRDIWKIYRAIDYTKAIPYAVRALQSHEERIASLEKENRDLKAELDWIKRAIA